MIITRDSNIAVNWAETAVVCDNGGRMVAIACRDEVDPCEERRAASAILAGCHEP